MSTPRTFTTAPAVRSRVPLIITLAGGSGSGKTWSALELATGMQQIFGGTINVVDTERNRALAYADKFVFEHTPFDPPYSPEDYSDVLVHVRKNKPGILVVDQLSYEHDGIGGVLEWHEAELDRMAGDNWQKREACNMAAWIKPKAARRRLLQEIVQIGADFAIILCFRAKETVKPVKKDGKTTIEDQGWLPIAGPEFLFEATASCVLYPRSNGVPTWISDFKGESGFMKLPEQFKEIIAPGKRLSVEMGHQLAEWAAGTNYGTIRLAGDAAAAKGLDALKAWYLALPKGVQATLRADLDSKWKPVADKVGVAT